FALLVLPAATAQRITSRPGLGVGLSVALALVVTWTGLACAYYSSYPIGFYVTTIAFVLYVGAGVVPAVARRRPRPRLGAPSSRPVWPSRVRCCSRPSTKPSPRRAACRYGPSATGSSPWSG